MPNKRIAMRKIHEILRLRFEVGLSFRQISQCADVSTGAIQKMLKRLEAQGSPGHFRKECQSPDLPVCCILSLTVVPVRWRIPTGLKSIWSCVKKASPATFCGKNTARGCLSGRTATHSSAAATRPGASYRNAPCVSSISPVKNALSTTVGPLYRLSHLRRLNAGRLRSSWRYWAHQTTPSRRLPMP